MDSPKPASLLCLQPWGTIGQAGVRQSSPLEGQGRLVSAGSVAPRPLKEVTWGERAWLSLCSWGLAGLSLIPREP